MFVFFSLICLVRSHNFLITGDCGDKTSNNCNKRTCVFSENNGTAGQGSNYFYFDPRTFKANSTEIMTTKASYVKALNDYSIKCAGIWCPNKPGWECNGQNKSCYNMRKIITHGNKIPELSGCDVDIRGNLIMAYGEWVNQLSTDKPGEKVAIYGSEIVKSAYRTVYKNCKGHYPETFPSALCINSPIVSPTNKPIISPTTINPINNSTDIPTINTQTNNRTYILAIIFLVIIGTLLTLFFIGISIYMIYYRSKMNIHKPYDELYNSSDEDKSIDIDL